MDRYVKSFYKITTVQIIDNCSLLLVLLAVWRLLKSTRRTILQITTILIKKNGTVDVTLSISRRGAMKKKCTAWNVEILDEGCVPSELQQRYLAKLRSAVGACRFLSAGSRLSSYPTHLWTNESKFVKFHRKSEDVRWWKHKRN